MKQLLIIYHSQSGRTRQMAAQVYRGACQEPEVQVRLLRAMEASTRDLQSCDVVAFGTPENFGYISGGLKDFFDRTFYPALALGVAPAYAAFISAGNDGSGAIRQLERIARGYPLRKVAEPVLAIGDLSAEDLQRCRDLGQALAAGAALGIF